MGSAQTGMRGGTDTPAAVHEVTLSPFFLSKYEMTQGQWLRIVGSYPTYDPPIGELVPTLRPVEQVSFREAIAYVNSRPRPLSLYYFGANDGDLRSVITRTWTVLGTRTT